MSGQEVDFKMNLNRYKCSEKIYWAGTNSNIDTSIQHFTFHHYVLPWLANYTLQFCTGAVGIGREGEEGVCNLGPCFLPAARRQWAAVLSAGIWIGEQWNQVNCHSWNPHHTHYWATQTIKWKYEDSFLLINVLIASLVYNYQPKPGLSLSNWSHDRKGTLHYGISQRCCLPDFYIRSSFLAHFLRMKQAQY